MSKQSFSLHLDTFRDSHYNTYRQQPQSHTRSFLSSRKPRLSNRYSFQEQPLAAKDYRSVSNTHREHKREREYPHRSQFAYEESRYDRNMKPSIAYIDSEENPPANFMEELDDHINHLKGESKDRHKSRERERHNGRERERQRQRERERERDRQRQRERQREKEKENMSSYRIDRAQPFLKLQEEYKKQRIDNALLAKKIETKRKDLQSNDKTIMQLQYKLRNLLRESQKLKLQTKQEQAKNSELKQMIVRKDQKNRNQQMTRLHYRHSSSILDLQKEKDQFQQRMLYNNSKFYK